jgi:RND family efflux transporter MFP subunit
VFNLNKKRKIIIIGLAIVCIAAALVVSFSMKGHVSQIEPKEQEIPLVRTMVVASDQSDRQHAYSGEVRGRYESQLAFQVGGKIISRQVELGSQVHKGQRLMQIDPQDIQQMVNIQSAQVDAAKSQLDLAEKNLKRYEQLFKEDVISRSQLERYQSAYDMAAAAFRQARSQQNQGSNQMGYSSLRADKAGVISAISAEVGQVVGPGQPVITLVQDGEREIEIYVPENRLQDLRNASQVRITFWALPGIAGKGKIREIAPMADPVARTYKVRVSLVKQFSEIKLGMTASVEIAAREQDDATSIPLSALYQTGDTPNVWVVNNDTVRLRPVKIGVFGNDQVQILSGLNSGDVLVTAGVHKLREGQKVKVITGEK